MSTLRPECGTSTKPAMPYDTALYLIRDSVARRRGLIHGRLDGEDGKHCALGWFWQDNPKAALPDALVDEVAAVNDSLPKSSSPKERWKHVMCWLRWKVRVLAEKDSS